MSILCSLLLLASTHLYQPRTGDQLAASLQASGLPVVSLTTWTPETDPNHLLGRPGQYVAKVSWEDARFPASDRLNTTCCALTLESFDDPQAMQYRLDYVKHLARTMPPAFGGGAWIQANELTILRMSNQVTPAVAAEYLAWFAAL